MAWTVSHIYLALLIFLNTFTMLLCLSTYLNHGLPTGQNLEASVRSRIKRQIISEISQRAYNNLKQIKRRRLRSTFSLRTFCSVHNSHVFCSAVSNTERTTRSVQTQSEPPDQSPDNSDDTSNTESMTSSPLNRLSSAENRIMDIIHEIEEETIETINGLLHTNHERHSAGSSTLPSTLSTSTTSQTTNPTPHQHHIGDHNIESRLEYSNPGYHDEGCIIGWCYHNGICHYDPIHREKICL